MNLYKTRIILKNYFLFTSIFLFAVTIFLSDKVKAQTLPEMIDVVLHCTKGGSNLKGVTVTVYKNTYIFQEQQISNSLGKVKFDLPFGYDYRIKFSYPGCIEMFEEIKGSSIPKNLTDIFPKYKGEVPFFETTDVSIRKGKYDKPFNKVIFDKIGGKTMMDDEPYRQAFIKDVQVDEKEQKEILEAKLRKYREEQDRLIAEKIRKEKEAQELADKALRDKMDAEQKRKYDEELAKKLAQDKQDAEDDAEIAAAEERARLTNEANAQKQKETMESEAQRLKREEEEKALAEKKNKEVKENMQSDLLKAAAENERNAKQRALAAQLEEARANSIIEQMKRNAELKSKQEALAKEEKEKEIKSMQNQKSKYNEVKKLVVAAATSERNVKVTQQKTTPDLKKYVRRETPNVKVTEDNGFYKDVRTTVITYYQQNDIYRKERTFWGTVHYYKNNKEIDELVYNVEINYYSSYANK